MGRTTPLAVAAAVLILGFSAGCGEVSSASQSSDDAEEAAPDRYDGTVLYGRFCLSCHGETGHGDGVSSLLLTIKPRDFTQGIFKFKSTVEGLPSDDDLYRTISVGIGGTEMSSYESLPPEAIREIIAHVKKITVGKIEVIDEEEAAEYPGFRGVEEEDGVIYALINWFEFREQGESLVVPEPPPVTQALVDRGKELFEGIATCHTCHGLEGKGDGSSAVDLKDDWGFPISPRNFKEDIFKGGADPKDIYLRVMLGIPGTPMPASKDILEEEQDPWALVYYVLKLKGRLYIPK